jgi:hypothetical protein
VGKDEGRLTDGKMVALLSPANCPETTPGGHYSRVAECLFCGVPNPFKFMLNSPFFIILTTFITVFQRGGST